MKDDESEINKKAKKKLDGFMASPKKSLFWNWCDPCLYAEELSRRFNSPQVEQVGGTNVCGPASVLYTLQSIQSMRGYYVIFALDLYQNAKGSIGISTSGGKPFVVDVTKRKALHRVDPRTVAPPSGGVHFTNKNVVDWITLASIRNSENWTNFYNQPYQGFPFGATYPSEVESWYKRIGFTDVKRDSSLVDAYNRTGVSNLKKVNKLKSDGYHIIFFIDSRVLPKNGKNYCNPELRGDPGYSMCGTHFIVLESDVQFLKNEKEILLSYYDYGSSKNVQFITKYFLKCYYGYIAGRC